MSLLEKLPLPKGKSGWPWSEESQFNSKITNWDKNLPKISIITPSLNQGEFIEETIRSVLLQNYPKLEYIIIDGGSSDNSIEIIEKYEHWLTYWVSEEDKGQSEAINKGFKKANGEIYAWLNSDDILQPGALFEIAKQIDLESPNWLIGACEFISKKGKTNLIYYPSSIELDYKKLMNWGKYWIAQPSVFWNGAMFKQVGLLNEDLHYTMDVDLWFRMVEVETPKTTKIKLSCFRKHENAKTTASRDKSREELIRVITKKILQKESDLELNLEFIINELLDAHTLVTKLKNLNNHIVIGKIIKFWKFFINRNLKTD